MTVAIELPDAGGDGGVYASNALGGNPYASKPR
jgi:hypothetical protein